MPPGSCARSSTQFPLSHTNPSGQLLPAHAWTHSPTPRRSRHWPESGTRSRPCTPRRGRGAPDRSPPGCTRRRRRSPPSRPRPRRTARCHRGTRAGSAVHRRPDPGSCRSRTARRRCSPRLRPAHPGRPPHRRRCSRRCPRSGSRPGIPRPGPSRRRGSCRSCRPRARSDRWCSERRRGSSRRSRGSPRRRHRCSRCRDRRRSRCPARRDRPRPRAPSRSSRGARRGSCTRPAPCRTPADCGHRGCR